MKKNFFVVSIVDSKHRQGTLDTEGILKAAYFLLYPLSSFTFLLCIDFILYFFSIILPFLQKIYPKHIAG